MGTIFNPSGVRKTTNERVVKAGSTYSFPDAYDGAFEFFKDRPIEVTNDVLVLADDDRVTIPESEGAKPAAGGKWRLRFLRLR